MRRGLLHWQLAFFVVACSATLSFGQQKDAKRFNDARQRALAAGEIVSSLVHLIPKGLAEKAVGVGAFRCKKIDLLLEHAIICPGVISSRTSTGWSTAAFFRLVAGGGGRPDRALNDADELVLIFTARPPHDWLTRLKQARKAEPGPLDRLPDDLDQTFFSAPHVFAYIRNKKEWRGDKWKSGFWKSVGLAEDNDINKPLYDLKGHQVLGQPAKDTREIPTEILTFQTYLLKYWPVAASAPATR